MDDMSGADDATKIELLYNKVCALEEMLSGLDDIVTKLVMGLHGAVDNHTRTGVLGDLKSKYSDKLGGVAPLFSKLFERDPFEHARDLVMDYRKSDDYSADKEPEYIESIVQGILDRLGGLELKAPEVKDAVEAAVEEAMGDGSADPDAAVVEVKEEKPKKAVGSSYGF